MRKYLYVFISCCVVQSVFAEPSGVYQNQHVSSILIPRIILQNVLIQDDLISQTPGAVEKMMAKYDKLAGPLGQEPLTVNDITQICVESGVITQKEDCLNRVFNPVLAEMGKVRFINTCSGKITGGNNHCIDDIFVEGKKQNGNQYHQDVNVNPYTANGFAIEYAKKKGHDVWCSSEIKDSTVNCTTLDNKEFYSVKFKGTNNSTDSTIEKNLVQGICALFDSKYAIGTFRHQCKMNCGAGTEARNVIQKFGLTVHDGYSTDTHCEIYQPTYTAKDVKTYPGYEYMSRAFKSVQSVLDSSLVNVLETYVKLQGINVQSFNCEYSSRKYSDEMPSGLLQGAPVSLDDMLRCRINDTEVDFIFDDLFEGKEYERKAGQAAMQCILAGGDYGSDRICSGLTKQKCLSPEVQSMVPGGTRWDSKAEVCLLNRAEKARDISNALQVGSGIALAIVFTPTGVPFVALAAVGGSVALDMAFIGVERLNILEPASRARAFATDAQKCQIPIDSKYPSCSQEQVDCAWRVVNQHFARLDEILDRLNPDQLSLISDLMENTTDCLSKELLSSAVNMSTPNVWDKALNQADGLLLAAGVFISPENMVNRLASSAPKIGRIMSRAQMVERVSSSLDGARYVRIYVDNLSMLDIDNLVDGIQRNGFFVSSNIEDITQRQFIGFADRNVFAKWNNSPNNWLFGRTIGDGANISNRLKVITDAALQFSGNVGKHRVYLEFLPTATGEFSPLVNHYNRVVALVNIDGHKVPFYVSSGLAGKDAQGIASGVWYPIAGIGEEVGPAGSAKGWFNKMPDMNKNPAVELDWISARLNQIFDGTTYKSLGFTDEIPVAAPDFRSYVNQEFPNGVVPYLERTPNGHSKMPDRYMQLYYSNIQRIIDIFR